MKRMLLTTANNGTSHRIQRHFASKTTALTTAQGGSYAAFVLFSGNEKGARTTANAFVSIGSDYPITGSG